MAICPECQKQFPDSEHTCPEHGLALVPDALFASVDRDLDPGARVGDYEIELKLGEGSFGRVYRAVHPIIGRRVAVKVLSRVLSTDPQAVSRFIAEARAIVEVRSPHIVDIYSFGALDDGRQYYVMELLDGDSLEGYLGECGRLDGSEAMRILTGIAEALTAAHVAGIVHRDLKPENIFIARDVAGQPVAKLLDFGVAKLLGKQPLGHRTRTGALIGTPAYMAPEQALGLEVDHRIDVYAFGIVAFEMLAGRPPFEAESLIELVRMHANEPPPSLSSLRSDFGEALDAPLLHMLAKDPAARPPTIAACMEELRAACRQIGIDVTVPVLLSLRPPSASPSQPAVRTPTWDAETVPAEPERAEDAPRAEGGATSTVGGTAGEVPAAAARASSPRPAVRLAVVLGVVVVAAAAVFTLASRSDPAPAAVPPDTASATAPQPSAPAPLSSTPATGATARSVSLRVETDVAGARVSVDGVPVGEAPGPFTLARGTNPVRVEVRATGHEVAVVEVTPSEDRLVRPTLVPTARRPATRTATGGSATAPRATASAADRPEVEPVPWEKYEP